jgi:cadmium resistance transport/sequestration family protein
MEIVVTSILAFVATNIDDLFLLTLFFANRNYPSHTIIGGQIVGIGTLIAVALVGSLIGYIISPQYVGLMGLFPVYLGLRQLIDWSRKDDGDGEPSNLKYQNVILSVALVTIANGGDNIGIYIPFFVTLVWSEKIIAITIFLLMTLLWCFVSKYLAHHPLLRNSIEKYGHIITPLILILLGIFILYESNSFALIDVF